jgi:hypothetical protein
MRLSACGLTAGRTLRTWMLIPSRELEPRIPSCGLQYRQKQPWFTRIELPPRPRPQPERQLDVACPCRVRFVGQSAATVPCCIHLVSQIIPSLLYDV